MERRYVFRVVPTDVPMEVPALLQLMQGLLYPDNPYKIDTSIAVVSKLVKRGLWRMIIPAFTNGDFVMESLNARTADMFLMLTTLGQQYARKLLEESVGNDVLI
jgi:hypothetical protein